MTEASLNYGAPDAPASAPRGFMDLFYGTLFAPRETFDVVGAAGRATDTMTENRALGFGTLAVILVSAVAPVVQVIAASGSPKTLIVAVPLSIVCGVIGWAILGLIVSLLAYAFTGETRSRVFLGLSGLAALPWLLMGPVMLLKFGLGDVGVFICATLGLCVWLWTVLLFALALMAAYNMTAERVLIVLAAPVVLMLVSLGWMMGFISNIATLMPR